MEKPHFEQNENGDIGNTDDIPNSKKGDNIQSCHWTFTLNNWNEQEYTYLRAWAIDNTDVYIIAKEIGENQTKHLQCYVKLKKKLRLLQLKKINNRCHWEKARSPTHAFKYCMKDNDYITNKIIMRPITFPVFDRDWQISIMNTIKQTPDDRKIYWFWCESGNSGKTTFTKYLCMKHNAKILPEKKNDAYHAICELLKNDTAFDCFIFDIPRTSMEYINYGVIEKVKDGCFYSGKYEGGTCIYPAPHIICFANEPPDTDSMSKDRWMITKIQNPA